MRRSAARADLFRAAIARYAELDDLGAPISADGSAYEMIADLLERGVLAATRPDRPQGCMISSGMLYGGPDSSDLVAELASLRTGFCKGLERRIDREIKRGRLPASTDAPALARLYTGVMQGMSVQARDGASDRELRAMAQAALAAWPTRG